MSNTQDVWFRLLQSADRFRKLLASSALDSLAAAEVAIILRYALVLWPDDVGRQISSILGRSLRNSMGLCATCLKPLQDPAESNCITCRFQEATEDVKAEDQIREQHERRG